MKKLYPLLSVLFLVYWGCSKPEKDKSSFGIEIKDGLWYDKTTNELYTGLFTHSFAIGNVKGSFKNGLKDGSWVRYYRDEKIKEEGSYINGLKHSKWTMWYRNGNLKRSMEYNYGLPSGEWYEMNENGKRQVGYCSFENGSGYWKRLYENGQEKEVGYFFDGRKNGEWDWFYEDGKIKMKGNYSNGKRVGEWKFFSNDESLRLKFSSTQIDSMVSNNLNKYLSTENRDNVSYIRLTRWEYHFRDIGDVEVDRFYGSGGTKF